jgi:hypothetical protein
MQKLSLLFVKIKFKYINNIQQQLNQKNTYKKNLQLTLLLNDILVYVHLITSDLTNYSF